MTITIEGNLARLEGLCAIEEAETLLDWLRGSEAPTVDLANCEHLHTALLQTLLALRPGITALPPDPLLARLLGDVPVSADPSLPRKES
jgi:hypothetical protein